MNDRQKETFRRNLQARFDQSGLSRFAFARAIGIKPPYLTQILNGTRTGERSVVSIGNALGVPVCQLIGNHNLEAHQIFEKIKKASRKKREAALKILSE